MTTAHPDRFLGLAMLPMQDIDAAIEELSRAVLSLGLCGAMIGDHVNGVALDSPHLRPLWKAAEELDAVIFLHQSKAPLVASRIDRYGLTNAIGNPVERTTSFAALVFGGVMDAFPDLKVCLAHGGGYVCFGAGRMDWAWRWRPEARVYLAQPPSKYLPRFYYDSITHDGAALRYLIDSVGLDRVVFGTDFPGFAAAGNGDSYQPVAWIRELQNLTELEKEAILSTNIDRLLTRSTSGSRTSS
jgi:aminocarboxymuconate-semialdehyde decarboxylase